MDDFKRDLKVIKDAKITGHGNKGINSPTETFEILIFKKYKSIQHYLSIMPALNQSTCQGTIDRLVIVGHRVPRCKQIIIET